MLLQSSKFIGAGLATTRLTGAGVFIGVAAAKKGIGSVRTMARIVYEECTAVINFTKPSNPHPRFTLNPIENENEVLQTLLQEQEYVQKFIPACTETMDQFSLIAVSQNTNLEENIGVMVNNTLPVLNHSSHNIKNWFHTFITNDRQMSLLNEDINNKLSEVSSQNFVEKMTTFNLDRFISCVFFTNLISTSFFDINGFVSLIDTSLYSNFMCSPLWSDPSFQLLVTNEAQELLIKRTIKSNIIFNILNKNKQNREMIGLINFDQNQIDNQFDRIKTLNSQSSEICVYDIKRALDDDWV